MCRFLGGNIEITWFFWTIFNELVIQCSTDSKPQCSVNATNNTQVDESTYVMMECSVTYTTPFLQPQFNWSQPSEAVRSNISYAYSSTISTNVIPRVSSDKCRLKFSQPTNVPPTDPTSETATNAPTYNSSCTVADIYPMCRVVFHHNSFNENWLDIVRTLPILNIY